MSKLKIGLFVTGGIAAYKMPQLVRDLIRAGAEVRVAMTQSATSFVTPTALETVSKHNVLTDERLFADAKDVPHIELAQWLDLALVAPATANTIAKLANGIADNAVTATLSATRAPRLIVPAMNDAMWLSAANQRNVELLKSYGDRVLTPATGFLAEGYSGIGRMPDLPVITTFVQTYSADLFLDKKRVLITAGGTREAIDPVRYIGNESSGKMGTALANVASSAGAHVTLVTTADLPVLPEVEVVSVSSAKEMKEAVDARFNGVDVAVMAAAVADFHPATRSDRKIKKDGESGMSLELVQNPDILKSLGEKKSGQFVVGFAAETNDLIEHATQKLQKKHADMIIANPVGNGQGFNQDDNTVTLLQVGKDPVSLPTASKVELASRIMLTIAGQL